MNTRFFRRLAALALFGITAAAAAQDPAEAERGKQIVELEKQIAAIQKQITDLKNMPVRKPLTINETGTWKTVLAPVLSDDGVWFACRIGSMEADSEVILQPVKGDKPQQKLPAGATQGVIGFSRDSKWFAYTVLAAPPKPGSAPAGKRPASKVVLINLGTNEKTDFEGLRSFTFNGETASHVAFRKANPDVAQPTPPTNGPPAPAAPNNDLILRELATGTDLILGNVGEFAFNKKGTHLATTVDSLGQIGNGVHLRDVKTGTVQALDTGKATYQSLNWKDTGDSFTVLKGIEESGVEGKVFSVIGFSEVSPATKKVVYEPKTDPAFPKDFGINSGRAPSWTDDMAGIFVGISEQKRPDAKKDEAKKDDKKDAPKTETGPAPRVAGAAKPDMVIWHWKDERLQPQQQVQAAGDKAFNFLGVFRVKEKKFLRLADDAVKTIQPAPKHQFAIGIDEKPYALSGTLDGKHFEDIYAINLATGERKKALTKARYVFGASPDGTLLAYYEDGHFKTLEFATLKSFVLDEKATKPFINTEDDHNVVKMPTRFMGWSADSKFAIVSDNWDLWQLGGRGESAVNLTVDGQAKGIRYRDRVSTDPDEKGIDLTKPMLLAMYGEWTKKSGYGRVDAGKPGVTPLLFEDALIRGLGKARNAEQYVFLRETSIDAPEAHVADPT